MLWMEQLHRLVLEFVLQLHTWKPQLGALRRSLLLLHPCPWRGTSSVLLVALASGYISKKNFGNLKEVLQAVNIIVTLGNLVEGHQLPSSVEAASFIKVFSQANMSEKLLFKEDIFKKYFDHRCKKAHLHVHN